MRALRRFVARLTHLGYRQRDDDRLRQELAEHLALLAEEYERTGLPPAEALRRAHLKLGSAEPVVEAYRDVAGWPDLRALWQDLGYSLRAYRQAPVFALAIVITLGLAIGANTAIFSLLYALALRDLPVRDPETLVQVSTTTPVQGEEPLTYPMFRELSARQQVFAAVIGAWGRRLVTIDDRRTVAKGLVWAASGNLFEELGVPPAAGRLLRSDDMTLDPPAGKAVAVLGYGFWQRHYQGDVSIIGRTIDVDGVPFVVVGVAPRGFTGLALATEPDVTIPLAATPLLSGGDPSVLATSGSRAVRMIGRLRPGVTVEQARAQLSAVWPAARQAAVPPAYAGTRRAEFLSTAIQLTPASAAIEPTLRRQYVRPLAVLLGIAGLVLAVACANVATLLFSRAGARRHEIAVRLALGGSRWRVGRQMMIEGLVLSIAGAAGGVVLSYWACAAITDLVFEELLVPVAFDGRPDLMVIGMTTAVAVACGVACTAVPAWRATRMAPTEVLRREGRTTSPIGRAGHWLVGAQVAFSVVLLATSGVLIRSLSELRAVETGINRSENVVVAYPAPAHPRAYDGIDNDAYYREVLQRIEALPGVTGASISLLKPGAGGGFRDVVVRMGEAADSTVVTATRSPVAPGFLAAVGVPLLQGRDFDWHDNSGGGGVTILSHSLARRLFGEVDPLGQRVRLGVAPSRDSLEVIGIAADARLYDLKSSDVMAAYTPALQDEGASYKCYLVRGAAVPFDAVRQAVEALGREQVGNIVTLRGITDHSLLPERLMALASSLFGSMVLVLVGVGLFGLMSYAVIQRQREIGIRTALGADRRRVMQDVMGEGLVVTLAGASVGLVFALGTVRVIGPLLYGVTPHDPATLVGVTVLLVIIALIACAVPAWLAARIDPIATLRS